VSRNYFTSYNKLMSDKSKLSKVLSKPIDEGIMKTLKKKYTNEQKHRLNSHIRTCPSGNTIMSPNQNQNQTEIFESPNRSDVFYHQIDNSHSMNNHLDSISSVKRSH